jgi:hypothetical protein
MAGVLLITLCWFSLLGRAVGGLTLEAQGVGAERLGLLILKHGGLNRYLVFASYS